MKKIAPFFYIVVLTIFISSAFGHVAHAWSSVNFFVMHSTKSLTNTALYAAVLVPNICVVPIYPEYGSPGVTEHNPSIGLEKVLGGDRELAAKVQTRSNELAERLGDKQYVFTFSLPTHKSSEPQSFFRVPERNSGMLDVLYYDRRTDCYWVTIHKSASCDLGWCRVSGFLPNYFRVAFYIPSLDKDSLFISNPLEAKSHLGASYTVRLHSDGTANLDYKARLFDDYNYLFPLAFFMSLLETISIAFFLILFIEISIIAIYVRKHAFLRTLRRRIYIASSVGTLITLPLLWLISNIVSSFALSYVLYIAVVIFLEVLVVLFEGLIIYLFAKKKNVSMREAFVISFLANSASFAIGWAVLLLIDFVDLACILNGCS